MGDRTYSKTKLGNSIPHNRHISTKILSILLAILLVTTVFSSVSLAKEPNDDSTEEENIVASILGDVKEKISSAGSKLGSRLRDFINQIRENRKGLMSLSLVTRYQEEGSSTVQETSTRLRLLLPTSLDVNGDAKKDIRVWIIRRPAIDLRPPALCWKTSLIVRRLPSMDETMVNDFLEIYLEYKPRLLSRLSGTVGKLLTGKADTTLDRIRIGYQSPMGEKIPKTCIVSHKDIPHLIYPREKPAHRVAINPFQLAGKSQLNLLFSIADMQEDSVLSELSIQINHTPAVRNEFSIERSKDYFVRRGQTLVLSRKNVDSNVSLYIKEGPLGIGTLTVDDIPKKISVSWKLARDGYISLNTHGSDTGDVKAAIKGVIYLGFDPATAIEGGVKWKIPGLISRLFGKKPSIEFNTDLSIILEDLYVKAPLFVLDNGLPNPVIIRDFSLDASRLKMQRKGNTEVNFKILPSLHIDSITAVVNNVDVELENCSIDVEISTEERPTVTIEPPQNGETVYDIVLITGSASAPGDKKTEYVQLSIDGGDWIYTDYNCQTEKWSYEWDTNPLPNGDHTIAVQSFDGEYLSLPEIITVTVNNEGNNWYPLITIDSPEDGAVVSGIVQIQGTAIDPHGAVTKVEIRFNEEGEWIEVPNYDGTTKIWTYEWDTTSLDPGKYVIEARSFDGVIYSLETASIQVSIKGPRKVDVLDFSLEEASITVKNFAIHGLNNNNVTALEVPSFVVEGNGRLKITEDSFFLEAAGVLDLRDASILTTNASDVTVKLVDNLSAYLDGYGMALLSKEKIQLGLDADLKMHADSVKGSKEFLLELTGTASATVNLNDEDLSIDGSEIKGNMTLDITHLLIKVEDVIHMGANRITLDGNGTITISEGRLDVEGTVNECILDYLYINASLGVLYLSGDFDFSSGASLTLDLRDSLSFNLSSERSGIIEANNPEIGVITPSVVMKASASYAKLYPGGYASLSFYQEDFNVTCEVHISDMEIRNLSLIFNDYSAFIPSINGSFHAVIYLSANILIETGEDENGAWVRITIGGETTYVKAYAYFIINDVVGYINVDTTLEPTSTIEIFISGIPDNIAVQMNGSLSKMKVTILEVYLEDYVNISVKDFSIEGHYKFKISGGDGNLIFNLSEGERTLELGDVYINISNFFDITLKGNVDVSNAAGGTCLLEITKDETGETSLYLDAEAYIEINITDLYLNYENLQTNAYLLLSADKIYLRGSRRIEVTDDYIRFETLDDGGEISGSGGIQKKKLPTQNGFVLKNFLLNATGIISEGTGVRAEAASLEISGSLDINYTGNITMNASADAKGSNIYISTYLEFLDLFLSLQIESWETSGGGIITIEDKNISFISSSDTDKNIVVQGASIVSGSLALIVEDADVNLTGTETTVSIDLSGVDLLSGDIKDIKIHADLSPDATVSINTLWANILDIAEIRLHSVEITAPININLHIEDELLITIDTDGNITAGEFSIPTLLGMASFNLYGVDIQASDISVSIGVNSVGDITFEASGAVQAFFDTILLSQVLVSLNNRILTDVDLNLEGEGKVAIKGVSLDFSALHIEGYVSAYSEISLKNPFTTGKTWTLVVEEPGAFIAAVDGLDDVFGLFEGVFPVHIGSFIYSESSISLLREETLVVEGSGHLEFNLDINSLSLPAFGAEERDVDVNISGKFNGQFNLFDGVFDFEGAGEGFFDLEAYGSITGGDFCGSLKISWVGTHHCTVLELIKWSTNRVIDIDWERSWYFESGSGEFVIEDNNVMTTVIVFNENGEIVDIEQYVEDGESYQEQQGNQGQPLGGEDPVEGEIIVWIWLFGDWCQIHPLPPPWLEEHPLEGAVTLITRNADGGGMCVNSIEIIPGDKLNFTAWYKPAEDSEPPYDYDFVFNFGDGSPSQVVSVYSSEEPIKIHPDEHMYTEPGTYNATVTVIDSSNEEVAADILTIYVVEKYMRVSPTSFKWQYEDIPEQVDEGGKLHGSFVVKNIANDALSDYILNWSITIDTLDWGTDWIFEPEFGSIGPNESSIVNFSFVPPDEPGDYTGAGIKVENVNDPSEAIDVNFSIYYGVVELFPEYLVALVMENGTKTFENVFFVHSNRWLKEEEGLVLNWTVSDILFDDPNITVNCIPSSGTIGRGEGPTAVNLSVTAPVGIYTGSIKVQREGYPADNDTVNITIVVVEFGEGPDSDWVTPDWFESNDWRREWRARDDNLEKAAWYKKRTDEGWTDDYLILTLTSPITCRGFRINAKSGDHLDRMRVEIYESGESSYTARHTWEGVNSWPNHDWIEWDWGTSYPNIDKVKIRFRLEDGYTYGSTWSDSEPHWAVVWEFDFLKES